jgi:stage V sporulation protein AE
MNKREIIIVTDGDGVAQSAVEVAAKNIGGRCISLSGGNPTILTGSEIIELIKTAEHDPVVIMVDDRGHDGEGRGERALKEVANCEDLKILGIVAVASNGKDECGVEVNFSIDKNRSVVKNAVDKEGNELDMKKISGDTLSILKKLELKIPVVVGIGDPGKMDYHDSIDNSAPITTAALEEILKFHKQ